MRRFWFVHLMNDSIVEITGSPLTLHTAPPFSPDVSQDFPQTTYCLFTLLFCVDEGLFVLRLIFFFPHSIITPNRSPLSFFCLSTFKVKFESQIRASLRLMLIHTLGHVLFLCLPTNREGTDLFNPLPEVASHVIQGFFTSLQVGDWEMEEMGRNGKKREEQWRWGGESLQPHTGVASHERRHHCLLFCSSLRLFSLCTNFLYQWVIHLTPSPLALSLIWVDIPPTHFEGREWSPTPPFQSHVPTHAFPPGLLLTTLPESEMAACTLCLEVRALGCRHIHRDKHTHTF